VSIKQSDQGIAYAAFFSVFNNNFVKDATGIERYEERIICTVDPEKIRYQLGRASQNASIIETREELATALGIGGHFLIETKLMVKNWSEVLAPRIVVDSYDKGCLDYNMFAKPQVARFAKGRLRMEVLIRDDLRCRICGKSPDDERYLKLEVHHIKPWEEGGITEATNLITLCNLCHTDIALVDRKILFKKVGVLFPIQNHLIYEAKNSLVHIIDNSVTFKISSLNQISHR
jgi:hypothetical protein